MDFNATSQVFVNNGKLSGGIIPIQRGQQTTAEESIPIQIENNPYLSGSDALQRLLISLRIIDDQAIYQGEKLEVPALRNVEEKLYELLRNSNSQQSILDSIFYFYLSVKDLLDDGTYPQIAGGAVSYFLSSQFYKEVLKGIPGLSELTDEQIQYFLADFFAIISQKVNDIDVQWLVKKGRLEGAVKKLDELRIRQQLNCGLPFAFPHLGIGGLTFGSHYGAPAEFILLDRSQERHDGTKIRNYLFSKDSLKLQIVPKYNKVFRNYQIRIFPKVEKLNSADPINEFQVVIDQMLMIIRTASFESLDLRAAGQFIILLTKGWRTFDLQLTARFAEILSNPVSGHSNRVDNLCWLLNWGAKEHLKFDRYQKLNFVLNMFEFLLSNTDFSEDELRQVWARVKLEKEALGEFLVKQPADFFGPLIQMIESPEVPIRITFGWLKECAINVIGDHAPDKGQWNYLSKNHQGHALKLKRRVNVQNTYLWLNLTGESALIRVMNYLADGKIDSSIRNKFRALELALKPIDSVRKKNNVIKNDSKEMQKNCWRWVDSDDFFVVKKGLELIHELIDSGKYSGEIGVDYLRLVPELYCRWEKQLTKDEFMGVLDLLERIWNDRNQKKGLIFLKNISKAKAKLPFELYWITELLRFKGMEYKLGIERIGALPNELRKQYSEVMLNAVQDHQRKEKLFQILINDLPFKMLVDDLVKSLKNNKITATTLARYPILKGMDRFIGSWIKQLKEGRGSIEQQLFEFRIKQIGSDEGKADGLCQLIQIASEANISNQEIWKDIGEKVSNSKSLDTLSSFFKVLSQEEDFGRSLFPQHEIFIGHWIHFYFSDLKMDPKWLSEEIVNQIFPSVSRELIPVLSIIGRQMVEQKKFRILMSDPNGISVDAWKVLVERNLNILCYWAQRNELHPSIQAELKRTEDILMQSILKIKFTGEEVRDSLVVSTIAFVFDNLYSIYKLKTHQRGFLPFLDSLDIKTANEVQPLIYITEWLLQHDFDELLDTIQEKIIRICTEIHKRINVLLLKHDRKQKFGARFIEAFDLLSQCPRIYEDLQLKKTVLDHSIEIFTIGNKEFVRDLFPTRFLQIAFIERVNYCIKHVKLEELKNALLIFNEEIRLHANLLKHKFYVQETTKALYSGYAFIFRYGSPQQKKILPAVPKDSELRSVTLVPYNLYHFLLFNFSSSLELEMGIHDTYLELISCLKIEAIRTSSIVNHLDETVYQFLLKTWILEGLTSNPNYIPLPVVQKTLIEESRVVINPDSDLGVKVSALSPCAITLSMDLIEEIVSDFCGLESPLAVEGAIRFLDMNLVKNEHISFASNPEAQDLLNRVIVKLLNQLHKMKGSHETINAYKSMGDLLSGFCLRFPNNYYSTIFDRIAQTYFIELINRLNEPIGNYDEHLSLLELYVKTIRALYYKRAICHDYMQGDIAVYDQIQFLDRYVRSIVDGVFLNLVGNKPANASLLIKPFLALIEITQEGYGESYFWREPRQKIVDRFFEKLLKLTPKNRSLFRKALLNWMDVGRKEYPNVYCNLVIFPRPMEEK